MPKSYVWSSVGAVIFFLGCMLLIPMVTGLYYAETEYVAFLVSACVALLAGGLLYHYFRPGKRRRPRFHMRDGYAIITYAWLAVTVFSIFPYLLSGAISSVTDAFFESVSGFTMTGATVFQAIESQARCVLLWRSMTQWLGGLGVLLLFIALLNGQNQGSLQLFRAEGLGAAKQKIYPKTMETTLGLACIYLFHTIVTVILYCVCGMGLFDAINHGMTVISTGGFSTKIAGIGAFQNTAIEWITIIAMFLAGVNYTLFFHAIHNRTLRDFKTSLELRVYLGLLLFASVAVIFFNAPMYDGNWSVAIRHGVFQVTSIITTTGFVLVDFEHCAVPAQLLFLLLMLCGACAGSVGGGVKIDRHIILVQKSIQEIRRFLHPNLVTRLKSNHQLLDDDMVLGISTFFYIYIVLIVLGTAILSLSGVELFGALTAVMSCLGGVGPAMGIGESAVYYGGLPSIAKWALGILMLIGRLEIYAVLVLLHPFHKKHRETERMISLDTLERDGIMEPFMRKNDEK